VAAGPGGAFLVVIAVLASAITAFVYVRLIVLMYFTDPTGDEDDDVVVVLTPSIGSSVAITVGVAATVVLGIVPGFLLEIASNASQFLL
jgi:NADH-quinone oxidoreductase subunit N